MKAVNEGTKCFRTSGGLIMAQMDDYSFEDKKIRISPNMENPFYNRIGLEGDYIILGLPNWESGLYLNEMFSRLEEHYYGISLRVMILGVHQDSIFKSHDKDKIKQNFEYEYENMDDEDEDFFPNKNSKNHAIHYCFRKRGIIYLEDYLADVSEVPLVFVNRDLIGKEIFPVELNLSKDNWLVPYTEKDMELMNLIDHDNENFTFVPSIYSSFNIEEHRNLLSK